MCGLVVSGTANGRGGSFHWNLGSLARIGGTPIEYRGSPVLVRRRKSLPLIQSSFALAHCVNHCRIVSVCIVSRLRELESQFNYSGNLIL